MPAKQDHHATLRDIAKHCGVSPTTVCRVLQGHPQVAATTRENVQAAAAAVGYRLNPMVGAWMSHVRNRRTQRYTGTIAWVVEAALRRFAPRLQRTMSAAIPHAARLGYAVEIFVFEEHGRKAARLGEILRSRGIHGVVLDNLSSTLDFSKFPWDSFACVGTSLDRLHPRLPVVAPDFHQATRLALARLSAAGHRRIGLYETPLTAMLTDLLSRDAFLASRSTYPKRDCIPPLECPDSDTRCIQDWIETHQPDAILSNSTLLPATLAKLRLKTTRRPVIACLNWNPEVHRRHHVCGVDYLPETLACVTIDMVEARLRHHFHSLPEERRTILIEGEWREASSAGTTAARGARARSGRSASRVCSSRAGRHS